MLLGTPIGEQHGNIQEAPPAHHVIFFPHNPHPSKRLKKKIRGLECMLHLPIGFVQVLFLELVVTIFDLG